MKSFHKESSSNLKAKTVKSRNCQERSVPKFLKKMFYILEEDKHNDLVSWSNDGLAIIIKKPTEFAEKVLPLYFKHNNFASFIRQVNMYKFKKRKNYQYDHVYFHEMFQHGRIDLLRNIHRKCTEATPSIPIDQKFLRDDIQVDADQLMRENLHYKRIHKTLSTQVQFIEGKMKELKNEISSLYTEQMQSQENEIFLKKIIKALTKVYGYENIARVIELDVDEAWDSTNSQVPNSQIRFQENSGTLENDGSSLFQLSKSDDGYLENRFQGSPEYEPSEQYPTNDPAQPYENYQFIYNQNSVERQNQFLQDYHLKNIVPSRDYDYPMDTRKTPNPHGYTKWIKEYERMNTQLPLNQSNNHQFEDIQSDEIYRHKSQMYCGADF